MTVSTLKTKFKDTFGATLRVYNGTNAGRGAKFADDKLKLGTISVGEAAIKAGSEFSITETMTIDDFEKAFQGAFNIAIQVASLDNSYLLNNNLKLVDVKDIK